jgi:3-deoxy-D-manno-octulosonic-acid transferase
MKDNRAEVIVVDTVGDLLGIYKRSRVAFVGGSLAPYGGQNMLEPLFFATPVLFGPYVENFRDIADEIIGQGAGMMVQDGKELYEAMKTILLNEESGQQIGMKGREITEKQKMVMENTSQKIMEVIRRRQEEGKA